jgi:hypothetical protein
VEGALRRKKDNRKPAPAEAPPRIVIPELAIPPEQRELWRRHLVDRPGAEIAHHKELEEARRIIDQASRRPSFDQAAKKPQAPADALRKDRGTTSRSGDQAAKKPQAPRIDRAAMKPRPLRTNQASKKKPRPQPTGILPARREAPELSPSEIIRKRRAERYTWKAVGREIEDTFGITRHPKTLRRWSKEGDK